MVERNVRSLTFSVLSSGSIPKKGRDGYPGLGGLSSAAGRGAMVMPPVSAHSHRQTLLIHTPYSMYDVEFYVIMCSSMQCLDVSELFLPMLRMHTYMYMYMYMYMLECLR